MVGFKVCVKMEEEGSICERIDTLPSIEDMLN